MVRPFRDQATEVTSPVDRQNIVDPHAEQRRRLVPGAAADGDARQILQPRDAGGHTAVEMAAGQGLRQQGHRDVQGGAQVGVPPEIMDVEQHGPGGVGVVRHVGRPAGEVPDEPAVHRAGAQLPPLRPLPGAGDVVQQPADLGAGEVGVDEQARPLRHQRPQALLLQFVAEGGGAAALPDDGVVDRLSRGPVPEDGGLPLVGDADGGDPLGVDVGGAHGLRQGPLLRGPDVQRVVLHPAGLGVDLAEGVLGPGDDLPRLVEQNGPGTGGALVQGDDVWTHRS